MSGIRVLHALAWLNLVILVGDLLYNLLASLLAGGR